MILTEQEILSPLWAKLKEHYQARLDSLRLQNDTDKTMEATAKLRGRIAEVKKLITLDSADYDDLRNATPEDD